MADPNFAENPWAEEFWNLTRQGEFIKRHGVEVAKTKARAAGTRLGAPRPTRFVHPLTVLVQRRNIGGGDTNIVVNGGRGFDGDGPPGEDV